MLTRRDRKKLNRSMEQVYKVRRENLRGICAINFDGNWSELARRLGHSPSFLNQLAGPNPIRTISEKLARDLEGLMNLAPGYLDVEHRF